MSRYTEYQENIFKGIARDYDMSIDDVKVVYGGVDISQDDVAFYDALEKFITNRRDKVD